MTRPPTGLFLAGVALQVIDMLSFGRFVSQPDYTGPLVARLGGADIWWLVGWVVAAAA